MRTTHQDTVARVRQALAGYDRLQRKATTREGWLMLKFSCSRTRAERLLALVEDDERRQREGGA